MVRPALRILIFVVIVSAILALVMVRPAIAQTESVLGNFTLDSGVGRRPSESLISDSAGNLYGVAGSNSEGAVYELIPSSGGMWTLKILYEFKDLSDGIPTAGLIMNASSNLYGTCLFGGTS